MKTCTFKKALSLFIAVMMVVSCLTVLSVNAAAVKWDRFATVDEAIAKTGSVEWIPIGGESGNGRYVYADKHSDACNNDCTAIYGFAQDSTKIYVFIETTDYAETVTLRLDSKRDTLVARSHELVFKWDAAKGEYVQTKTEYGTDVEDNDSVTGGKFGEKLADFAGTAFIKGNSYEYGTKAITKAHTGTEATERTGRLLVVQLRKDRLQGNLGNGNFDYVSELGFDIEILHGNGCAVNSSNSDPVKLATDATGFNLYSLKEDRVVRFDLDGKISDNEFWKDNEWQLITGANGQLIMPADIDQTDIAYSFQIIGDNRNVYIGAKLYGLSYKDGDNASSFKVYLNINEENAKKVGLEPTAVLEFVFDGSKYVFVGGNTSEFPRLETATTIAADGHAEIEIKIPYSDLRLASSDFKYGDPYNYLGFNFEFTAPALYTNEQALVTLVGRAYGKDADHPAYNCNKNNYFSYSSGYSKYSQSTYSIDRYTAEDYNNNLACECGKVVSYTKVDAFINELADDYAANKQIVVNRISDALKTGEWTGGQPGADENKDASFLSTYFDYLMYSDGDYLYAINKGVLTLMGKPGVRTENGGGNGGAPQTNGNHVRFWFGDGDGQFGEGKNFKIIDAGVNFGTAYNDPTDMWVTYHSSFGADKFNNVEYESFVQDDCYMVGIKVPVADFGFTSENIRYAITNSFFTKIDSNKAVIDDSRCQLTSGRYIKTAGFGYTSAGNKAYRVIGIEPATKLERVAYTADEALKKNVLADVDYTIDYGYLYDDAYTSGKMHDKDYSAGYNYYDYRIEPSLSELSGIAVRGYLNDGKVGYSNYGSSHADRTFAALKNMTNTNVGLAEADAANSVSFKLLRNYNLAGFKAVFTTNLGEAGVGAPNYVDVFVSNDTDTQRVGRFYAHPTAVGTVEYDITLNTAVVGNKVTFKFDNSSSIIFAVEFQAYAYGDLTVTTNGCNANNGGYDPVMLYGQNANNINNIAWWNEAPVFKYDTNLGAYYRVAETVPYGATTANVGNYKNGDFAITTHSNIWSDKATAAQKANYNMLASIKVGERVYLYNNAHADANYDLMMQPTSDNFFITIGNALMSKSMTAYNPTVGYKYNVSDLGQIGNGKSTMILIDSQSVPTGTEFDAVELPVDSFNVGSLLNSSINLWNYNVAIVEYDSRSGYYYVANFMSKIAQKQGESNDNFKNRQNANNVAKRALSFTTQGFAIVSLNDAELFDRLSRIGTQDGNYNNFALAADVNVPKSPDTVYLYDIDLDALRLSYGNAGALNAKITFNHKNGGDHVTTTESWVDLAEISLNDLTERWMKDLEAIKSQVSTDTYNKLKNEITANLTYARAYGLFANKFNSHEYTAGLRANPWVLYDGITEVNNLAFDENLFALYNRNSQWAIGASQTAGIMLMNTNKNYEKKTEVTGFNKNFAALHDNDYAGLNYLNKITYTFYYDFANGYSVPETLRVYTSANYSFMNHTKPFEVSLKDKTSDEGKAYPTSGSGLWTITVDMPLTKATAIYTEFDFTSKQLGVVEINEKCVITDLMTGEINGVKVTTDSCVVTISNTKYPALTSSVKDGVVTINHDHSKHNANNHTCTKECVANVTNSFYGNSFVDLEKTPYLHIVMDVPSNLSAPSFKLNVYYNGTLRYIDLTNVISRDVKNGKLDVYVNFADFCKNTYGMTLKSGELLQLDSWNFSTKFADTKTSTLKISTLKFVGADSMTSELKAGSDLKLDADKKLLILDKQYKEDALKQEFTGDIAVEGTAKSGFVGTGATVTANGVKYTVVLYGDLNGDGALNAADYIMIRRAILKSITLDDVQTIAAIGPKASKITATSYIQIRQHVLGTYNFFKGEKIAQ